MLQATDYDKVSSAYATALVELAQEKNALDTVHADVDSLQVCLESYARARLALSALEVALQLIRQVLRPQKAAV